MKSKKLITLIMALTLCVSMVVPAFAATNSTVINAKYDEIQIDVTVPTTATAVINPYGMPVKAIADDGTSEAGLLSTAGYVSSQPMLIVNSTEIPLYIGATVTATSKNVGLTTSNATDSGEKQAQIYLEVQQDKTIYKPASADGYGISNYDADQVVAAYNAWKTSSYAATNTNQVICQPEGASSTVENMAIVNAYDDEITDAAQGNIALARLGGTVAKKPESSWSTADSVTVNVAWTFSPVVYNEVEGGTITIDPTDIDSVFVTTFTATYTASADVKLSGNETYVWSTSDEAVIKVTDSAAGGFEVVADGTATISVVVTDNLTKYTAEYEITVS